MGKSIALRFSKITESKCQTLLNFDRNYMKLYETGEKLPKDSGEIFLLDICQKCGTYGPKHEGGNC